MANKAESLRNSVKIRHFLQERFLRKRDLRMLAEEEVGAFWEQAHQKNAHLWLTGSDPSEVLVRLGVNDAILELQNHSGEPRVLDVGVGEGLMSNFLSRNSVSHDSLDISSHALSKVGSNCRHTFLSGSDLPDETYDVIMHHLVAQHMSHQNLSYQLTELLRALRPGGTLSLQYSATQDLTLQDDDSESHQKMGAVTRNPDWFSRYLKNNDHCVIDSDAETDTFGQITFRVIRIRRTS